MRKKRIIVLYGGQSTEHEISRRSVKFVLNSLDPSKYEIIPVGINKDGLWLVQNLKRIMSHTAQEVPIFDDGNPTSMFDLSKPQEKSQGPIVVFPVLHGTHGEDGCPQGFFELRSLAYVGAGVLGSALAMDKDVAKKLVSCEGMEIAPYCPINILEWKQKRQGILQDIENKIEKPWFVKPASLGSSVGVKKAKGREELSNAIDAAFSFDTKILVESEVQGREIEFAALGGFSPRISDPGEIVANNNFYSYTEKYSDMSRSVLKVPAPMSQEDIEKGQKIASQVFKVLNLYGMCRIDFFYTQDGRFIFNEANTIPGFTEISQYPQLWAHSGLKGPELIDILIETAVDRWHLQAELSRNHK